ncbi:unnamed protein product [Nippostrongylus brasiliensis]|uniref:Phage protein n=1 Tax=Nippostrongylus brasiliensis TaxID=27835 RepID=A0A0N4XU00_NIPBR|nr:unnamed protein product [Nippostrongylus brasiliensis]
MARIPSRLDVVDINELKGLLKQENTTRMLEDLKRKLLELKLKALLDLESIDYRQLDARYLIYRLDLIVEFYFE